MAFLRSSHTPGGESNHIPPKINKYGVIEMMSFHGRSVAGGGRVLKPFFWRRNFTVRIRYRVMAAQIFADFFVLKVAAS